MPHDVIMPALGMTQDTGLIVAWHKQPGDAVKAGDILLEVETDKTTMEVEAGHTGYVAAINARAGDEIPVGTTIAEISDSKPDSPTGPDAAVTLQAQPTPSTVVSEDRSHTQSTEIPDLHLLPATARRTPTPSVRNGQVLASPKAKRLARERGLDISRLVELGVPQPYHVVDLDRLATLPTESEDQTQPSPCFIATIAETAALDALAAEFASKTDGHVGRARLLAALVAGAFRNAIEGAPASISVGIEAPGETDTAFTDLDRRGLAAIERTETDLAPTLIVRDLCASRITTMRLSGDASPVVTLTRGPSDGMMEIAFEYDAGALTAATAIAFLDGLTERIEMPILNLL